MLARRPNLVAFLCMLGLLAVFAVIWLPLMPNGAGRLDVDYSLWLPDLLAGYFWYLQNGAVHGLWHLPWFSPAQCGGIAFHADPQIAFLSLPQFLTFMMPPLAAIWVTVLVFAALGFWGAWLLARRSFLMTVPAALLTAGLFLLNGFFAVRMVAGHLTYAPFMLLPALAALALPPPGTTPGSAGNALRAGLAGLLFAIAIEAGMIHALPPLGLSLVIVLLIHALRFGGAWTGLARLLAGGVIGLALTAGKLAASLSLLAQFPRTLYPLPGISNPAVLVLTVLRSLFFTVTDQMGHVIANAAIAQEQHEFEYGVSPGPALLMLAWVVYLVLGKRRLFFFEKKNQKTFALLVLCLAVPVALNFYQPEWNHLLKGLPFFGSSSTNLRWISALILPAILGGGLALDSMPPLRRFSWPLAGLGLAVGVATIAIGDHRKYGAEGMGIYDPADIDSAWRAARASHTVPTIAAIGALLGPDGKPSLAPERQNAMAHGFSELFCYAPLWGYRLENFPMDGLRGGDIMDAVDGHLNVKNPACYVFPAANACKPGDLFAASDTGRAENFISYRPFAFNKPLYATLADWLGILTALALGPALLAAWLVQRAGGRD